MRRILFVLVPSVLFAQSLPEKTRQAILTAQDLRDARQLSAFLADGNAEVRSLAARSCGSVQDTVHLELLLRLLSDKDKNVRLHAAFALGQMNFVMDSMQRGIVSQALLKRLGIEENRVVLAQVLEALGKVGDEYSLNVMVGSGETFGVASLKCEAALAVGRYAYRGIRSKTATAFAVGVLTTLRVPDVWKAAYALMRINDASLLTKHTEEILSFTSHANADVRMFIATALAPLASSRKPANALLSLCMSDSDWRVRVNALKAIAKAETTFYPRMIPQLLRLLDDPNEHVRLATASCLADLKLRRSSLQRECREALMRILHGGADRSAMLKKQAAVALARMLGPAGYSPVLEEHRAGNLTDNAVVSALAYIPTRAAMETLVRFVETGGNRIRREALEAIVMLAKTAPEDSGLVEHAMPAVLQSLESDDMPVIVTAASALEDSVFRDERAVPALTAALRRLKSPQESEAMIAVIQSLGSLHAAAGIAPLESKLNDPDHAVAREASRALERITGKSYNHLLKLPARPSHTNFDWELLDRIRQNPVVNVQTTKGAFTVLLLPEEAPFTCISFVSLAQKHFYDSLVFHRVVPNFVIQGGDPRGDGWGGPGYAIRSEFGLQHYRRGMVGVASSGKDTEGSQWFVTHCNTPHLDGRYTIFGEVLSGMDVVDKIQVGDRIVAITLGR